MLAYDACCMGVLWSLVTNLHVCMVILKHDPLYSFISWTKFEHFVSEQLNDFCAYAQVYMILYVKFTT